MIIIELTYLGQSIKIDNSENDIINSKSLSVKLERDEFTKGLKTTYTEDFQFQGDIKYQFDLWFNKKRLENDMDNNIFIEVFKGDLSFFKGELIFSSVEIQEYITKANFIDLSENINFLENKSVDINADTSFKITQESPNKEYALTGNNITSNGKKDLDDGVSADDRKSNTAFEIIEGGNYGVVNVGGGETIIKGIADTYTLKDVHILTQANFKVTAFFTTITASILRAFPVLIRVFIYNKEDGKILKVSNDHVFQTIPPNGVAVGNNTNSYQFDLNILDFIDYTFSGQKKDVGLGVYIETDSSISYTKAQDPNIIRKSFINSPHRIDDIKIVQSHVIVSAEIKNTIRMATFDTFFNRVYNNFNIRLLAYPILYLTSIDMMLQINSKLTANIKDTINDIFITFSMGLIRNANGEFQFIGYDKIYTNNKILDLGSVNSLAIKINEESEFNTIITGKNNQATNLEKQLEFTDKKTYVVKSHNTTKINLDLSVKSKMDFSNSYGNIRQNVLQVFDFFNTPSLQNEISEDKIILEDLKFNSDAKTIIFDGGRFILDSKLVNAPNTEVFNTANSKRNILNYTFSPQEVFKKWSWLIGINDQQPTLLAGEKNNDLIVEGNDIKVPQIDATRYITNRIFEVEVVLEIEDYIEVKDNLNGYIEFTHNEIVYQGYINQLNLIYTIPRTRK